MLCVKMLGVEQLLHAEMPPKLASLPFPCSSVLSIYVFSAPPPLALSILSHALPGC